MQTKVAALVSVLAAGAAALIPPAAACTTILVSKGASVDGSTFVTHSEDCFGCDMRIMFVPAADHAAGSQRAVCYDTVSLGMRPEWNSTFTKRYVGSDRGPDYVDPAAPQSVPLGYIPQVSHTYAYFDGNYGIINEKQLAIGECTDEAKVDAEPLPGKRIFYSAELSRVALERCAKARDAIKLMGELIAQYGYYGTGETLLVADPDEGWVMEMCAYDKDGADGVWVAKKVPDGELFVGANMFMIRQVDPADPDIMYSANLFDVAKTKGWWDFKKYPFMDWAQAYGTGEGLHPYASLRRVWSVFSRLSPSSNFPIWVKNAFTTAYPFSVKPDAKLSVDDVMALHRCHYEGTEFDLTKNYASGPYGFPQRWRGAYDNNNGLIPGTKSHGAWERPISMYNCSYIYVNQIRPSLPDAIAGVCWMGMDEPYNSCLVPIYVGVSDIPKSYKTVDMGKFEWGGSLWWAFNFVSNWIEIKYRYAIEDVIAKQSELEGAFYAAQAGAEAEAMRLYAADPSSGIRYLTTYSQSCADTVDKSWWALAATLISKYSDGYIYNPDSTDKPITKVGYPSWWLLHNGYKSGPVKYSKYKPAVPKEPKGVTEEPVSDGYPGETLPHGN